MSLLLSRISESNRSGQKMAKTKIFQENVYMLDSKVKG